MPLKHVDLRFLNFGKSSKHLPMQTLPSKLMIHGCLAFAMLLCTSFIQKPSCDPEKMMDACAPALEDFVFIKSFAVECKKQNETTEYSYVLSRGVNYRVVICDEFGDNRKMTVSMFDRNRKLIATNYLKSARKHFPSLSYNCAATGVYYFEASFGDEKKACGINILGFKK